jgi:glycerol kinase
MRRYVLALDQGTTSSRAIIFDRHGNMVAKAQREFPQLLPAPGVVEHDPEAIWESQRKVAEEALQQGKLTAADIAAIGIANQRETTILWDRNSGQPVAPALVWQSRVSAPICERWKREGYEALVRDRTGLVIDPYFSASKIAHLLEQQPGLRSRAERGEVLFGTVDSFLIWRLTDGKHHVTDVSNASRTMMMNLQTLDWDDELLAQMQVPRAMLPRIASSSEWFGETTCFGDSIPITGCAGDQQAATFGQVCFSAGAAKSTYGTGCFVLLNAGQDPTVRAPGLLTTVGWQLGSELTYCLEGSVFIGGAVVQWLRDGLGIIAKSEDVESLAAEVDDTDGVYFVPAFVGLGAPYWDPYARGTIVGLTRGTRASHLALAALQSMAFQTRDVLIAMQQHAGIPLERLRVDGGAACNSRLMQFQADILRVPVDRPMVAETTALGAAYLAGLQVGYWPDLQALTANWQRQREFVPVMGDLEREQRCERWNAAVARARHWELPPVSAAE